MSDAAGADEEEGKGKTPKEEMTCESNLGHEMKNLMTVIQSTNRVLGWGAIEEISAVYLHGISIRQRIERYVGVFCLEAT